jgi:hypothetical protein
MARRYVLILSLIAFVLLIPLRYITAQGDWTAWVYQPEAGQLLRVDSRGTVVSSQRITPPTGHTFPQNLYFANDGQQVAYITESERGFVQQLHVLNLATGTQFPTLQISVPDTALRRDDYFMLTKAAFSLDGAHLIYTRIVGGVGWSIDVLEIATGTVLFTLSNTDEIVRQYSPLHAGRVPLIQSVRGDAITFTIATGMPITQRSYTWFYRGSILSETVAAPSLQASAYAPTGDIVNPLPDWRFAAEMEMFDYGYQQVNSLHIYETAQQARYPFYTATDLNLQRVWFVQGGEAIVGEAEVNVIRRVWVIIGRDGAELRRLPVAGQDVTSTPDGFVYVTLAGEESTALVYVNTRTMASAGETVWAERGAWRVFWAGAATTADFRAWARLAEPIVDPSGIPSIQATPTALPPFEPLRTIGMPIQIYTEEDEYLNLRDAPSTDGTVLALLEGGTQAIITDGPVDADGYRWWQIRVGNRTGWVVEMLPDVLTLIPPQLIPEKTEEPED